MVAISIVTYNTADDELRRCLDSIPSDGVEHIYVIDNSQSESTRELCGEYPTVSYIPSENIGYGAAHNIAMRRSLNDGTKYHLILNSDICFEPSDLNRLINYMDENPDVGAVQPRLVNSDGSPQMTVRMLPTPFDLIIKRFFPQRWFKKRRGRYLLTHFDHSKTFNAPNHQGSFMMLRVDALRTVGLFDERFFMYPEDIDLTRRIHKHYRTMYAPVMTAVHAHRAASYHSTKMLRIHIVNMIRYFNKWGWINDSERRQVNRTLREM